MARNVKSSRSYFQNAMLVGSTVAALALTPAAVADAVGSRDTSLKASGVNVIGDRPGRSTSGQVPIGYVVGWRTGPSCPNGHCNWWAPGTYWTIDTGNGQRLPLAPRPRFSEAQTFGMVIAPNGVKGYVTADVGQTVTPVDLRTNRPYRAVALGCAPIGSTIVPTGRFLYVLCDNGTVRRVATTTNGVGSPIRVPRGSNSIAASPGGSWIAVAAPRGIWFIDTHTDRVGARAPLPGTPTDVAFSPTGTTAYAVEGASVVSVDMSSFLPASRIPLRLGRGEVPSAFAVAPDGLRAYVITYSPYGNNGGVVPIDLARGVAAPLEVLPSLRPTAVAITPDSKDLYVVSSFNGVVADFAVAAERVIARSVGLDDPSAIAIGP